MRRSIWVLMNGDGTEPYAAFRRKEDCPADALTGGDLVEVPIYNRTPVMVDWASANVEAEWRGGVLNVTSEVRKHETWPWYDDSEPLERKFDPTPNAERVVTSAWVRGPLAFVNRKVKKYKAEFRAVSEETWRKLQETGVALEAERLRKIAESEKKEAEQHARLMEMYACPECRKVTTMTSSGTEPCEKHREYGRYPPNWIVRSLIHKE